MLKISKVLGAAAISIVLLTACGDSGPSDRDVSNAVRQISVDTIAAQRKAMASLLGDGNAVVEGFRESEEAARKMRVDVGQKTKRDDGSWTVVVTYHDPATSAQMTSTVRMVKAKDGWRMAQ